MAQVSKSAKIDPATDRVIASIGDDALAGRYPDRTHFVSADNPHHGEIAIRALFEGDPVAIVYPDGHELLVQPPPRARIEVRDSNGLPIAA